MPEHIAELVWEQREHCTDLIAPLGGGQFYKIATSRLKSGHDLWLCGPGHLPQFLGYYTEEDDAINAAITHSGNDVGDNSP
jgi:hypothetical protein